MAANTYYYSQEGHLQKRPRKGRLLTVVSIILLISFLSMTLANYFIEPVFISRLTKGKLYGYHTTQVDKADINNNNILRPTDKEIKEFSSFAKKLSNRIYLSLSSEEKEDFNEIKDGAKKITAHLKRIESAQNPNTRELLTAASQIEDNRFVHKDKTSLMNLNLASIALGSSKSLAFGEDTSDSGENNEDDVYSPELLNDIATFLFTNGYPELAKAVASMAASGFPENPLSALNLGTILREANANEDAFNVLQYALRLSPDSEPILYSLGMCALDLGNTPYAEACFSKILSLNASSGPGHQGMMLCYMDTESYSSAFLHMLEGAREGYTKMVTETYKVLREKNEEYKNIAKPILEQYTIEQLLDFTKSRTPFDSTLDTPAGQLEISRDIRLGRDSVGVYSSSDALNNALQYVMKAYSHGKATFDDAFSMINTLGGSGSEDGELFSDDFAREISKSILKKIFDSASDGQTVSSDGWLRISYEAEVFWLNILDDYIQFKLEDYLDEYFVKPYEEAYKEPDSVSPSLFQYNETFAQLAQGNPIQAGSTVLNNLVNNNSVYDKGVQKANRKDMDKFLETINPKLEEGYKKTADLMEVYWLHYGTILGQIGNDETYNRYQQSRKTTVACALTPYVAGGAINCFLVTMNYIAVDSDNRNAGGQVSFPEFPDFPDSQMGTAYKPPQPKPPATEDNTGQQEETTNEENTPDQEGSTEATEPGDAPSETAESEPQNTSPITTEDSGTVYAGPLSITVSDSGWEIDFTAIGSVSLRYDKKTGDVSLFGGTGLSLGLVTSGGTVKGGVYAAFNTKSKEITSGNRYVVDVQIAGNGIAYERQICATTGVDTTTLSAILLHKKSSQTIFNN